MTRAGRRVTTVKGSDMVSGDSLGLGRVGESFAGILFHSVFIVRAAT